MGKIKDTLKKVFNRDTQIETPKKDDFNFEKVDSKYENVVEEKQANDIAKKIAKELPPQSQTYEDALAYTALLVIKLAKRKLDELPPTPSIGAEASPDSFNKGIKDGLLVLSSTPSLVPIYEAAKTALTEQPGLAEQIPKAAFKALTEKKQYKLQPLNESKELGKKVVQQLIDNVGEREQWLPEEKDNLERLATLKLNAERGTVSTETKNKSDLAGVEIASQLLQQSEASLRQIYSKISTLKSKDVDRPVSERDSALVREGSDILLETIKNIKNIRKPNPAAQPRDKTSGKYTPEQRASKLETIRESDTLEPSQPSNTFRESVRSGDSKSRSYTQSEIRRADERTDIGAGRS